MNNDVIISVSDGELALLSDVWELGYGELHSVNAPFSEMDDEETKHTVTSKEENFIRTLRREGSFDIVAIHEGQPVSAQKAGLTRNGISCLKKFRF